MAYSPQSALYYSIHTIVNFLFEREEAHLRQREEKLVAKHMAAGGSRDGFKHMGKVYTQLTGAAISRGKYDRLSSDLAPEASSIMTVRRVIEADRSRIQQALYLVLKDTRTPQDVRDALPNCLQDLVPTAKGLARTREEAYTLRDNPRAYSQYMMLRDKIEFYVASRLLY
jgi:hypothetical protein